MPTGDATLDTILVATDFSDNAGVAFSWAAALARQHEARLVVVHAMIPAVPPAPEFVPMPAQYYQDLRATACERLEALVAELRRSGLACNVELVIGPSVPGILEVAVKYHADLIVAGTRGHTGWKRIVLGSTAARLMRDARSPVLTVHPHDGGFARPPCTILVPTDFSADAWLAAETALRLLAPADAGRLFLLHAYRLPVEGAGARAAAADELARAARAARSNVEALAQRFARPNLSVESLTLEGHPAEVIVDQATQIGADLIAMGTHGRSALERIWIGSTAERVVAAAACPVLTVRGAHA